MLVGLQFVSVGVLGEFLTYLHQKRIRPEDLPIRNEVGEERGPRSSRSGASRRGR